jgi:hypothetical protein
MIRKVAAERGKTQVGGNRRAARPQGKSGAEELFALLRIATKDSVTSALEPLLDHHIRQRLHAATEVNQRHAGPEPGRLLELLRVRLLENEHLIGDFHLPFE